MHNRGLAAGILRFIGLLGFFALLYGALDWFMADLFGPMGLQGNSQKVIELQTYMEQFWILLPALLVLMLATRLVARAVFESRGGVR